MTNVSDPKRELLRHALATLAYRGGKAVAMRLRILLTIVAVNRAGRTGRYSRISAICSLGRFRSRAGSRRGGIRWHGIGIRMWNGRVGPEQAAPEREFD
jgi:hypothetical protein